MPVTWNPEGIAQLLAAGAEFRDNVALTIAANAKPPQDTGFLHASAYISSAENNLFDQIWDNDYYVSSKTGKLSPREHVDAPPPYPEHGVIIGWAAIYAWYVEDTQPFIYPALLEASTAGDKYTYDPRVRTYRERATGRFASLKRIFGG
jgi:hypothetical protein